MTDSLPEEQEDSTQKLVHLHSGLDKSFSSVENSSVSNKTFEKDRNEQTLPELLPFKIRKTNSLIDNGKEERKGNSSHSERINGSLTFHHPKLASQIQPTAKSTVLHSSVGSFCSDSRSENSKQTISHKLGNMDPPPSMCSTRSNLPNPTPRPDISLENASKLNVSIQSADIRNRFTSRRFRFTAEGSSINNLELEGDSSLSKVLLCAFWHKGVLGASIYHTDTRILQLLQDVPESADQFTATHQVFLQSNPTVLITSSHQDHRFTDCTKNIVETGEPHECQIVSVPPQEIGYEISKRRLLRACEEQLAQSYADKDMFINSIINVQYINMVRSAGGLLHYLDNNSHNLFNTETEPTPIINIEIFYLDNLVWISHTTLSTLKIMNVADHPSTSLGCSYQREGFSLYGLMGRCKTSLGRKKLLSWFLRPSRDLNLLNERLDCIQYFSQSKVCEITNLLKAQLSKLRNMTAIVSRMKKSALSANDWLALYRVLGSLINIAEISINYKSQLPIFNKICELIEGVHRSALLLTQVLDVKQTREQRSFTININYDEELDRLVQRYRDLPEILGSHLDNDVREIKRVSKSSVSIHYSSQLGCLLIANITPRMERTGDYNLSGFHLEFITEDKAFYSCESTVQISEQYGDVKTSITDRELLLMYQLQNTLIDDMCYMLQMLDLAAQLDSILALSSFCVENNYVRPEFSTDGSLNVLQSRHALLEQRVDNYVPNNIISGVNNDIKVTLLTGPNASGKSIYLKQIAIVVYLAHIGCFVPAAQAFVPLIDSLHCHFDNSESISSDISTFTSDIKQISRIINNCSKNSLIILDEFGKGTSPVDGAALILSLIKYWLESTETPHVFLSSHFHVLSKSTYLRDHQQLAVKKMDSEMREGKIIYLYELVDGMAKSSHAAQIARLLQIPEHIIQNGQQARDQLQVMRSGQTSSYMLNLIKQLYELDVNNSNSVEQFIQLISDEQ